MKKLQKFIEDITKKPLTLITWVILTAALIWGIVWGIKKVKKMIADKQRKIEVNDSNLTYDTGTFITMADQLFSAMNGMGTNEDSIMSIIRQIATKDDWNKLVNTFGTRKTTSFWSSFEGDLYTWLQDELSTTYIQEINSKLSAMGVTRLV